MKKIDLAKLAAVGFAAGLCLSGQKPVPEKNEVAMSKCSKTTGDAEGTDAYGNPNQSPSGCHGPGWENHPKNNTSQLDKDSVNKSAAQRVVDGTSNSSMNGKRKSAAQRATEY